MAEKGITALVEFARLVSDAGAPSVVSERLADALSEHVCHEGIAVFLLGTDGKLRVSTTRNLAALEAVVIDVDEMNELGARVEQLLRASGLVGASVVRPLVAAGDLYGVVVMLCSDSHPCRDQEISVAEGLIDLAATAFGTTAHVAKLERQQGELRRQQEMLARNEKLRALGQMAAGISHDLRNILNPLSLHLQVMTRALARAQIEDAQESVVEMRSVLQRGLESLERLRNFSRQSRETKTEPIDVNQLAREATAIGKSRAPSTSSFRVVDELGTPPPVMAISGEIVSALVNLVVNAVDAMTTAGTKSGTITLRSGETEEAVWVEIADNGPGMTPEIAKHVFDPFFTTKGEEGTGLGLAMVYSTMQRHGGLVTVDTKENQGSCFRLHFPKGGPGSQPLPSLHPSFLEPTSPRSPSSSEPDSDVSSDQPTPRRHDVQSRITRRR